MSTNPATQSESRTKTAVSGKVLYKPDPRALADLARSTSIVIATLLAVPDAFALIPGATSTISWALRLLGVWVAAAAIWFVGFLAILHLVRLAVKGVEISEEGVKLWRFARILPWSKVGAISIESQFFFSKLFRLRTVARRLTLYERKKARKGFGLAPHYLPSFFFDPAVFEELCLAMISLKYGFVPQSPDVFVANEGTLSGLKSTFGKMQWQRTAISILIAVGLVLWLARKAGVNYAYNEGNQSAQRVDYSEARERFEKAVKIEPTFAPAWNNLGIAEFRLGHFEAAKKDWEKAIWFKPDYVEPKISLAHLAMMAGNHKAAKDYLDSALNLCPLHPYALVNRADLEMETGRVHDALEDCRIILAQEKSKTGPTRLTAACLLARAKLRLGEPLEAARILKRDALVDPGIPKEVQNISLKETVCAEVALALGQNDLARKYLINARKSAGDSRDVLIDLATLAINTSELKTANEYIELLKKSYPNDAAAYLLRARVWAAEADNKSARDSVAHAVNMQKQNPIILCSAAKILLDLGDKTDAATCARRALSLDPRSKSAKWLLSLCLPERKDDVVSRSAVVPNETERSGVQPKSPRVRP